MKRNNTIAGNIIAQKTAEYPWWTRAGAFGTAAVLAACGVSNEAPTTSETPPATQQLVLSEAWPKPITLEAKDCSWGQPIDHQTAKKVGGAVAAIADSRCEPPFNQPYAAVYRQPSYAGRALDVINNGESVAISCVVDTSQTGSPVPVGDSRGPQQNMEWYNITFVGNEGAAKAGFVNGANLGQLERPQGVDPC